MTFKHHPYARPPKEVVVFAHVVGSQSQGQSGFVPAGIYADLDAPSPTFTYGRGYVKRAHAVEVDPVALPLKLEPGGEARHLLPGLTEFGGLRDAAPDAWGRRVIENKLKVRAATLPEVAYLLEAGSDRVGALDVRRELTSPPQAAIGNEVTLERLLEVADRIEHDEPVPEHLAHYLNGLGSAGGARPKATVRDEQGVLWLAKFPSKGDKACNAVLEGGALELARAAGLRVPPIKVVTVAGKRVLLIRRFDRYWAPPSQVLGAGEESWCYDPGLAAQGVMREEGRLGVCSALTLMALDEFAARESSYQAIAAAIRARTTVQFMARDLRELFLRMVFNIFTNNNDDHLRNHAFTYDLALKGWRLSPLYDVLPMNTIAQERRLHLDVGASGAEATLDNAMSQYSAFLNTRREAVAALHQIWLAVRQWQGYFEQLGATPLDLEYLQGALRPMSAFTSPALEKEIRRFEG